jgi:glycosyltransferase involved in cell wall biosynthesis
MPSVSVVTCAYNAAEFIAPAIQSILDQTLTDIELLIVDDASTDTTRDIIRSFKDSRIRVFYHEKNRGSGAARNTALREAKGEYIALMDADDVSLPTRLAAQKRYLDKHKSVGVLGIQSIVLRDGVLRSRYRPHRVKDLSVSLLLQMCFTNPTLMIRHDVIQQHGIYYQEDFKYGEAEDFDWVSKLIEHTKPASLLRPGIVYRMRSDSQYHSSIAISEASAARIVKEKIAKNSFGIRNERRCSFE